MKIGVDYYPENWDKSLWETDAETMAKTGVKLIRIGDGAWQNIEPADNNFDVQWLKDVILIFAKRGIGTVLCIPTDVPPDWLIEKYPEIMPTGKNSGKSHRCINSPVYLQYVRRMTETLVKEFADNRAVMAWQIDNEIEAYPCTCDVCVEKFRNWLMERHGSLENINSMLKKKYTDISKINLPYDLSEQWKDPSLCLEFYRFASESVVNFTREEMKLIRIVKDDALITTSADFGENCPDYYKLFEHMNFVSYNNYPPVRIPKDTECNYSHAFELDLMRGVKGGNFCVTEQLSGPRNNNGIITQSPKSGMIMGYAMQAIFHGADMVFHYHWRTALYGERMFSHGILDHSNTPNRRLAELTELCNHMDKIRMLDNTYIESDVAIVYSPTADVAFNIQPQSEGFDYVEQLRHFHTAFMKLGANVDVVSPTADLSKYRLVIVPSLYVNDETATGNIYQYVMKGGTAVLTSRSGVKDEYNNCIMETLPTVFRELVGVDVSEYDPIGTETETVRDFAGRRFECSKWCDVLRSDSARSYAVYSGGDNNNKSVVTMNRYCDGVAYYVGTIFNSDFYESFVSNLMMQTGIPKLEGLSNGVEVITRTNGREEFICFFNNTDGDGYIPLPKPMYCLIGENEASCLELKPFGIEIVRK